MRKNWKIMFFYQQAAGGMDALWTLLELGLEPQRAEHRVPDTEYSEQELECAMRELGDAEMALTIDFSAVVAEACHRKSRIYLSYVYDSPQIALYMGEALYDTNIIFVFDKAQLRRLKEIGIRHVFYEPLCANVSRAAGLIITDEDIRRYAAEISLVGNLYQEDARERYITHMFAEGRTYLEQRIEKNLGKWGSDREIFREDIEPGLMAELSKGVLMKWQGRYQFTEEYIWQLMVLSREITYRERLLILNMLSEQHEVRLYTGQPDVQALLPRVQIHPRVEYETETPKVYYASKINLNITLSSIETGVPQRVFDVLSVGGFVLSNAQEELRELFEVGREVEEYADIGELQDKAAYYLMHEQERIRIGIRGYQKVKERYTFPNAFRHMLDVTEETFGIS